MLYYSWIIKDATDPSLKSKIIDSINDSINLCASVGCSCITGGEEEEKHLLEKNTFTHIHSGPHWRIIIIDMPNRSIKIDFYIDSPIFGHELYKVEQSIKSFNLPTFLVRSGENF